METFYELVRGLMADNEQRIAEAINYKIEGSYDEAAAVLVSIIAEDDSNAEAHRQLGLVYGFQGMFDESLEELGKAVQMDDSRADMLCDLAMTHAMLGMYEEAKTEFLKVLSLDPDNKTAKEQMVYFSDLAPTG